MADPSTITTPAVVVALIEYTKESGIDPKYIYVFDNSAAGMPTRAIVKTSDLDTHVKRTDVHV
jgi:hypothetical protein